MNQNKKLNICIVGSGISSLTSAYILSKKHNVDIYDKNDYIGGHTHTHKLTDKSKTFNVDSGFIVYNENTYPNFIKLLNKLKVESQKTSMGFSVKSKHKDFEYSGNSLNSMFAQRSNIIKPKFITMVYNILKFNKKSKIDLEHMGPEINLEKYLFDNRFNKNFINNYIIPMGAAIWSTSPEMMLQMPATFFIRFFQNHGLLDVSNMHQWWVIKNGSKQYVKEIIKPFYESIYLDTPIDSIERKDNKVIIHFKNQTKTYDCIVIGTHSNQALSLLKDPTKEEKSILNAIKYQKNIALIHHDESILPKRKLAWSSWNYLLDQNNYDKVSLTYNMNILQSLKSDRTFCVTLNNNFEINANKIIKEIVYHHPLFTKESVEAQNNKNRICGHNNTYFCGAYWGYGFHEDGVNSAIDVCKKFGLSIDD